MRLHFDDIKQSKEYTLKNLKDSLNGDANFIRRVENKVKIVKEAFNSTWHMDENLFKKQFYLFIENNKNEFDVVNFAETDKYHHLKLFIDFNVGKLFSEEKTLAHVYLIYYHLSLSPFFPDYYSKYTMPYIVDDQYIAFITFDEEEVSDVTTVASDNMYDLSAELVLIDVPLKGKIFTKITSKNQI